MANPAWPTSLPQFLLVRNYKETAPDDSIRTQMDAGPAKVRRRFTANVRPVEGLMILTSAQAEVLDDFYLTGCAGGATAFAWTAQRTFADSDTAADSDQPPDSDIDTIAFPAQNFRFVKPPLYSAVSPGLLEASLSLEILP